jgi:hypothetical protein
MRTAAELAALAAAGTVPVLAYLAIGLWLARALKRPERGAERLALCWLLGTGAASLAILTLRALDLPVPLVALAALALAGLPALRDCRRSASEGSQRAAALPGAVDAASLCVAALLFVSAFGPEIAWDAVEYHLPMIQAWTDGPIRAIPGMLDAEFRAGADLLFVPAVAAGQPDAAGSVSAGFGLAIAALVRAESRRRASATAGSLAGLFSLLVPFTFAEATAATVDLAVGAYGFAALLAADRWNREGRIESLTLAALCLGFAANAKLHAAVLLPVALALVLLGGRPPPARPLLSRAALCAALITPWFVKTGLTTGNPVFPLLGGIFGYGPSSPELLAWKRGDVSHYVRVERSLPGFFRYLASLTFGRTYHVSGLLGPLPLALAPLAWTRPARPTLVLIALLAVLALLQFLFMPALRFGAPLLPFYALAAAVGGARLAGSGLAGRRAVAAALVVSGAIAWVGAAEKLAARLVALREPSAYERAALPAQANLREVVARGDAVVAIPRGAVSWMPKPVYNLHWSRNGELFFDERTNPDAALALLRERGVHSLAIEAPRGRSPRVGHPIVDAWLARGDATLVPDPNPPSAGRDRVWRLVRLR